MSGALWRSQSLKNLSSGSERSWALSETPKWAGRKSVSQLVQQYQSCAELNFVEKVENVAKIHRKEVAHGGGSWLSVPRARAMPSPLWQEPSGFRGWTTLTRSQSMEVLPQRESRGPSAIRALFESRSALGQDLSSSPCLNTVGTSPLTSATTGPRSHGVKGSTFVPTAKAVQSTGVIGRAKQHNDGTMPTRKDTRIQRTSAVDVERRKTISGVPASLLHGESSPRAIKEGARLDPRATSSSTDHNIVRSSLRSSLPSVKDRSALYLSKAAAADPAGIATQQGRSAQNHISSCETKSKQSKMSNVTKKIKVTDANGEDDLPPPPPPPPPPTQRPQMEESATTDSNLLPVPPPKETFSTFYQQRQKSELRRLFKHIHPDVKMNLDDVIDDEFVEALQSGNTQAADSNYQGEVQSMRWIFENWTLDNIGDPHVTKKLLDEENLQGGDVQGTSSVFEQGFGDSSQTSAVERPGVLKGDVRTATWLFETKPLECLGKSSTESEIVEAVLKEPMLKGDVSSARLLFESKPLDTLGRCCSVEDRSVLRLKSELEEQRGDVKKTVRLFQAEPNCALRDSSGNIHEIKSICREEIQSSNFNTARWLFETKPLDVISKDSGGIQIIRGISLEEAQKGGVERKRWMFETQPLDAICEGAVEEHKFEGVPVDLKGGADVVRKQMLFETQSLADIKGEPEAEGMEEKEVIVGGDVKSSLWLFETQPTESLKDSFGVGSLKRVTVSEDERGEVRNKRQTFESMTNNRAQVDSKAKVEDLEKGDVKSYKHLFETIPMDHISPSEKGQIENLDITAGSVKDNKALFESTPLYAIKDSSGNFHEVTTVSREEIIRGSVQNFKWMFETKPLDRFEEGSGKLEVIEGITRQEDSGNDVRMAKWLFETTPMDNIHLKFNKKEKDTAAEADFKKGDVKTCKWLFETQPMDVLSEKSERIQETETVPTVNVKSHTWLFESQPLDNIKDGKAQSLRLCNVLQNEMMSERDVKTVKHLFETETLDSIKTKADLDSDVRYVSQIDVQSGDVSRVKEIFESQSLDEIGSELLKAHGEEKDTGIQAGSVHKFTWLFENQPISAINEREGDATTVRTVVGEERGDVGHKKFIFETFPLGKIEDKDQLLTQQSMSAEQPVRGVDVKSSTMLFESQPLYAIKDKEGQFHEVTTVKKEEILSGDVRGARWMFETKPLDAIQADKEIYVIRAVTQEDTLKGDVKLARWRFETQPLDSLTSQRLPLVKVEDNGQCINNVQINKKIFESELAAQKKYVRMVSVTDVQQGDVRTSTWLFETQPIDTLKGEQEEQSEMQTVQREEVQKGDVKRCTWLFESKPLDQIQDTDHSNVNGVEPEYIPKADVRSTTWMFETTPLDKITVATATETLCRLSKYSFIHSSGIIIQARDVKNVDMAKFQFVPSKGPNVQKEETVEGNIKNIMFQLLNRPGMRPSVAIIQEDAQGNIQTSTLEILPHQQSTLGTNQTHTLEKVATIIENVLVETKSKQIGLVMQESMNGQPEMTVYSLQCQSDVKEEKIDIQRGDIKSTIGNLLATAEKSRTAAPCKLEVNEKGNVDLYRSCIEKGDLQSLKNLQVEDSEVDLETASREQIEIIQGDVKEAKRHLKERKEHVEKTVQDIMSGDVKTAKQVFLASPADVNIDHGLLRDEIIPGDIFIAKQQLDEALKQPLLVQKEEIISGDIKATMESLERAKQQSMHIEKEVIIPGTIYDLDVSAQESEVEERSNYKEKILSGDIKAAKQSLEEAKCQSMRIKRDIVVPGNIYDLKAAASHEGNSSEQTPVSADSPRIKTTIRKVSAPEFYQRSHDKCEAFHQSEVEKMSDVNVRAVETDSEANKQVQEEPEEVIKGDVKATIHALYCATTEQRAADKEEIVRGDMQAALKSLKNSSVNVSQGDYKAAMIYRKAGQTYSKVQKTVGSGTVYKQNVISLSPSDNELSTSVSVIHKEHRSNAPLNSAPIIHSSPMKNLESNIPCPLKNPTLSPPPLPPKTCDQAKVSKPALLPKPQCKVISEPKISNGDTHYIPAIPTETQRPKPSPSARGPALAKHEDSVHIEATSNKECKTVMSAAEDRSFKKVKQCSNRWQDKSSSHNLSDEERNTTYTAFSESPEMEKNVIQRIDAAEEIRLCMQAYSGGEPRNDLNVGFKVALQNFGGNKMDVRDEYAMMRNTAVKKSNSKLSSERSSTSPQEPHLPVTTHSLSVTPEPPKGEQSNNTVVMREKRGRRETEDERRQRLSVHRDEIMRGNVKATMEIFENLRKREELKSILCQVQEMEEDASEVDVKSLSSIYENVPSWLVAQNEVQKDRNVVGLLTKNVDGERDSLRDETESISSVETAFEDLEKASLDIMCLKEQTLVKLMEIEETIKKALYSVSNLKNEADITGLSGLFNESMKTEQSSPNTNNIRKISIVTSKSKTDQSQSENATVLQRAQVNKIQRDVPLKTTEIPHPKLCPTSPSSPSFISIHSAARRAAGAPSSPTPPPTHTTNNVESRSTSSNGHHSPNGDFHRASETSIANHFHSPRTPKRKTSTLKVQTLPEPESVTGIFGTKTVSETYEERDCFGNSFVSSTTSTFVSKQSDTKASCHDVLVHSNTPIQVIASPLLHRLDRTSTERKQCPGKDNGKVFVTFGHKKTAKD